MDRELNLSVYQGPCKEGDFTANLATVRRVTVEALARGSDFLVFPETFLSGYDNLEKMRLAARRIDDPELSVFIAESTAHKMVICVGLARITEKGTCNSVLVIQGGRLLGIYNKVMLTQRDRDVLKFVPGEDVPVFEANGARFAVNICHDTSFPYPALLARLKGAEILFTPHYNSLAAQEMDAHRKWVRNCHIGLACQLKMIVARSNVVVTDIPGQPGYGDSFIISPMGEMLAEAALFREELLTAKVGPEMFKFPYVWANLNETPKWLKERVAGELDLNSQP